MKRRNLTKIDQVETEKRFMLIVEDNKNWRDIICQVASEADCHPICAASFPQALKIVSEQKFELISLDLDLQDETMLGRMFLQMIPTNNKETPIIIVTGVLDSLQDEILGLVNYPQVSHIFLKQNLILNEFKKTINDILRDAPARKKGKAAPLENATTLGQKSTWKSRTMQLHGKHKFSLKKIIISTILGLLMYATINLPFIWLAFYSPEDVSNTPLIIGNLLTASIALVFILSISGAINNKQAVSIILALVSAISAAKLFSPQGQNSMFDSILEKAETLKDLFIKSSPETDYKK
jgi:DNA-binding response OmpR family regulator